MTVEDAFRYLDIMGLEFQFKINGNSTYKTSLGGIYTILLLTIAMVCVWGFGKDIIEHVNPLFYSKKIDLDSPPFVNLTSDNFIFALRFNDDQGNNIYDHSIMEPVFIYEYYQKNNETGNLDMTVEINERMGRCNTTHIDNTTLYSQAFNWYYCASIKNYRVGGSFNGETVGTIGYKVKKCSKETEEHYGIKCKTIDEIKTNATGVFYTETKYINNAVDPTSKDKAITKKYEYDYQLIELQLTKIKTFQYSFSKLKTDNGWILPEILTDDFLEVYKTNLDFQYLQETTNLLYFCDIQISTTRNEYERSYIKVVGIAATVGGFMNLVLIVFQVAYYMYAENHMTHFLYTNLFDMRLEGDDIAFGDINETTVVKKELLEKTEKTNPDDKKDVELSGSSIIQFRPKSMEKENLYVLTEDHVHQPNELVMESSQSELKKNEESKNKKSKLANRLSTISSNIKKNREKFTYEKDKLFKYRYCICYKNPQSLTLRKHAKGQLFYLAEYEIEKKLDAINILKQLEQVKTIKQILLNEDQMYLLELRGNKVIKNNPLVSKKEFKSIVDDKKEKKDIKVIEYLKKRQINQEYDEIDDLLVSCLNEDYKIRLKENGIVV